MATAKGSNRWPGSILSLQRFSHPPGSHVDLFRSKFFLSMRMILMNFLGLLRFIQRCTSYSLYTWPWTETEN